MAVSLDTFAASCRQALTEAPGAEGRARVNALVRGALADADFVATYIPEGTPERHVLYEDPDLGFTILAHAYTDAKTSGPHDHGSSWAIYGQAAGQTVMTDWDCLARPAEGKPGRAVATRSYSLAPGDAHLYEPGAVHSPRRDGPTRLLRIEGMNMDRVTRYPYEAIATAAAATGDC